MSLLESKFTRTLKSPWNSEADRTVRAVIGAVNVDIDKASLLKAAADKMKAVEDAKKQYPDGDWHIDSAGDKAECLVLKPAFLRALVQGYQWRLLLHARGKEDPPSPPAASTTTPAQSQQANSWWMRFMELKRPPFASLEYYIGPTNLFSVFQPRQQRPSTVPTGVYDLPVLEVAAKDTQPLVIKSKPAYKFYDLSKPSSKGWSACQFYEYIKATPPRLPQDLEDLPGLPHQPGTVGFTQIDSTSTNVREDKLGKNLVLLPFEKTTAQVQSTRIRCFILSNYDSTQRTAAFRGVGDFAGLNDTDLVPMDGDLEMW
jgi:hypothetical protein